MARLRGLTRHEIRLIWMCHHGPVCVDLVHRGSLVLGNMQGEIVAHEHVPWRRPEVCKESRSVAVSLVRRTRLLRELEFSRRFPLIPYVRAVLVSLTAFEPSYQESNLALGLI